LEALRTAGEAGQRRLRLFRAADAFAIEAFRAAGTLRRRDGEDLGREIRRTAARAGGAVVAASARRPGDDDEVRLLRAARTQLIEGRYYLYLARRLGLLDLRGYRAVAARQDSALREVEAALPRSSEPSGAPRSGIADGRKTP
jgi:four helix bundle protein